MRNKLVFVCILSLVVIMTSCASGRRGGKGHWDKDDMSMGKMGKKMDLVSVVEPFYTQALTVNDNTNLPELVNSLFTEDFQTIGSAGPRSREELAGQLQFFWQLIPDMKWEIQDVIQKGNQVVVRSLATGSPVGNFFGVETDGSKSYSIMTIDIHTVEDGKVSQVYHVEDWATALQQLVAE